MDEGVCPYADNNCENRSGYSIYLGSYTTYVSLVSSSFSCFGALSIILTYLLFKELRTSTRSIITFLAIADFFTALGYIVGGTNYLLFKNGKERCGTFETVCAIQSYVTTWSQLCSYLWNCFLALYLYLMIVYGKHRLANRLLILFHSIAWILPICIALPLLVTDHLGYSPYAASNWCFIKDSNNAYKLEHRTPLEVVVIVLIAGKVPEIFSYLFMIIFYTLTRCFIRQQLNNDADNYLLKDNINRIDKRLLVIPLVFVLLRIWGTLQFFFIFGVSKSWDKGCIRYHYHIVHVALGILEAIGDGGQGWANSLIFVFFNARTRRLILGKFMNTVPFISRSFQFCCKHKHQNISPIPSVSSIKYAGISNSTNTDLPVVGGDLDHSGSIN